jgi:hypothetical protein
MPTTRTVLDLLTASLQAMGAIAVGETPSAEDVGLAMETLQDLLGEWSDGGLMVPCLVTDTVVLTPGLAVYTWGESGAPHITTARPEQVMGAYIRDSGGDDFPVDIIGESAYRTLTNKSATTGRPDRLYPKYSAPNATLSLFPMPDAAETLYIVSSKVFIEPSLYVDNLVNTSQLPRNYFNPLKWNLALELCPAFTREPTPLMLKRAMDGKSAIRKLNMARSVEPVALGVFDYNTRDYSILEG